MFEGELRQKYVNGPYTEEQLRAWAHLVQMKKQSSHNDYHKVTLVIVRAAVPPTVSTCKHVNLHGQCVQQLLQLHELLEKGGINQKQYDEMQTTIMSDVKKFDT